MSKKKQQTGSEKINTVEANGRRPVLIIVSIFVSAVLLFGAVFGTVLAIREANSVVEYNGARMDSSVAHYFAAYAKAEYLANALSEVEGAEDTAEFWNSYEKGLTTYGDGMRDYVKKYLAMVVAGCYIYDSVATLDRDAKNAIRDNAEQRLLYIADGSRSEFNSLVEKYGFDYDAFYKATEMMYKTLMAPYLLYGEGGESLKANTSLANEYYNLAYHRVKLLFIRTESDFNLIEVDGVKKRELNEDGTDKLYYLTTAQKEERLADIATIDAAIKSLEENTGGQMSSVAFEQYLEKYEATNLYLDPTGEYYSSSSDYAERAFEEFPEVVARAMTISVGGYAKVEIEGVGVCYLEGLALAEGAYTSVAENGPFSDFYVDLADYKYKKEISLLVEQVSIKDRFFEIDLISLPANGVYTIGF